MSQHDWCGVVVWFDGQVFWNLDRFGCSMPGVERGVLVGVLVVRIKCDN